MTINNDKESSTRKQLLMLMKTKGAIPVSDMAKELGITEMAVRRHLNTMERDGLIESKLIRQPMGRPSNLYSLTERAQDLFPRNYHHLTLDLLEGLAEEEGADLVGQLFERRQNKMFRQYEERMAGKTIAERVEELARIQNENGYMAQLEREESGDYVMTEFNCPISQVANQYKVACHSEMALFEKLLGTKIERTECMTESGSKCMYRIKTPGVPTEKR